MPYWLACNGPGRLGGHGHSPYRLSRRVIRHATFDHKQRARKRWQTRRSRKRWQTRRIAWASEDLFFSYPFCPFAPTAPSPNFPFFATLAFFGAKSRS